MKPKKIHLIATGCWNKRIFTPDWVSSLSTSIYEKPEIGGLVNPNEIEYGYSINDLKLFPKNSTLEIENYKKNTIGNLKTIQLFKLIYGTLPHTPLKSVGLYISFENVKLSENHHLQPLIKSASSNNIVKFIIKNSYEDLRSFVHIDLGNKLTITFALFVELKTQTIKDSILNEFYNFSINYLKSENLH